MDSCCPFFIGREKEPLCPQNALYAEAKFPLLRGNAHIAGQIFDKMSAATIKHEVGLIRSTINEMARLGYRVNKDINYPTLKTSSRLRYLDSEEESALLHALDVPPRGEQRHSHHPHGYRFPAGCQHGSALLRALANGNRGAGHPTMS